MINPNKFHSVEKTTITIEGELKNVTLITKVVINQIDPSRNISVLYEINRMSENKENTVGHPYEVKLHSPEHQAKSDIPISWIELIYDVDLYVNRIREYFNRGRLLNVKFLSPVKGCISRNLTYNQTKAILRFENRASRNLSAKPIAVRNIDPTKINKFIKCDTYFIESWKRGFEKHRYTSITNDADMDAWIRSMKDSN